MCERAGGRQLSWRFRGCVNELGAIGMGGWVVRWVSVWADVRVLGGVTCFREWRGGGECGRVDGGDWDEFVGDKSAEGGEGGGDSMCKCVMVCVWPEREMNDVMKREETGAKREK